MKETLYKTVNLDQLIWDDPKFVFSLVQITIEIRDI